MGGCGDDPTWMGAEQAGGQVRLAFGQVDAIGADARRQGRVGPHQQDQALLRRYGGQPPTLRLGAVCAEMAEDDAGARGQAGRDGLGVGGADRVGDEQQRGQGAYVWRPAAFPLIRVTQ